MHVLNFNSCSPVAFQRGCTSWHSLQWHQNPHFLHPPGHVTIHDIFSVAQTGEKWPLIAAWLLAMFKCQDSVAWADYSSRGATQPHP